MSEPVLRVRDICVDLLRGDERRAVLREISFDLHERRALGIIGESGSGKTVLARLAIGAVNPPLKVTEGQVLYRGRDLLAAHRTEIQRLRGAEFGYIGSNPASVLDPTIPVGKQIVEKLTAIEPGIARADAVQRIIELMAAVRLPSPKKRFHEFPFQYSGGMMQRALIVDALIANPAFLIADNVTQPLDVTVAAQIIRLMQELREKFSTAVIFVSNSVAVAREIAEEIIVLNEGRIVEHSTPAQLIVAPKHSYSKRLIERIPRIWSAEQRLTPSVAGDRKILLRVEDVHKTYRVPDSDSFFGHNNVEAVRGVTFDVLVGENFGIVGESGCGKSTLSRLLSWVETPDRGSIRFQGVDVASMGRRELLSLRSRFQLLLQDPYNAMPPHMPVGRTIAEPLHIHRQGSRREIQEQVLAIMDVVGLPPSLHDSFLVGLSAGQLQRVNLARALVLKPQLLILDETLSSLDQVEQSRLLDLFESLQAEHGFTYIFISHDLAMVRRACTRIAVMYLGKIVELADNRTVFFEPGHPYTKALLSAVPTIEPRRYDSKSCLLEGEPPSPIGIPPGCSFRPRCPLAFDRCRLEEPPLIVRRAGGESACFWANASANELTAAAGRTSKAREDAAAGLVSAAG
jgi:peptide/nickel transport system ATP-binding protein